MAAELSKILIFGGTGYIGQYMVRASVSMGHPTYVYARPITHNTSSSKLELHREFESMGVTIFQGKLEEHEKLVSVLKQVDVVISTLPFPQILDQFKIINAMKIAGNIKRFFPSDFGNEEDRTIALPPFQAFLDRKRKIRRATEAAGIPHTFVSANSYGAYFADYLLHPRERREEVIVYGSGEAKAVLNFEGDIAAYTVKAANDPRTCNRTIIYKPPANIVSQLDLISSWEKKTGQNLRKVHFPEEEIIKLSESKIFVPIFTFIFLVRRRHLFPLPHPDNVPVSILHNIFIKGEQTCFELGEDYLEASKLYPDYKYTTIDSYLDICLVNPPKIKLATFA
ncbi:hypothetical protein HHK36_008001 [Tetracentron sinense]|uniref:NmrA-like domain-containing protein n=1 Tax=Tetracentron sinense TaxID=13715 RepID=A0A834ZIR6_TETSI|nr:hypothetical protein HHK36_008001 [Tetracentron sinense]